ncbi:MAG: pyridoxamine 5'-phosphate oxidase family protein [Fusobacteriaceae bacterium]|jgi:predicted pyridoxine 5'-phosphate oxidase superfamily flavin-nucleotide-binding protein|nr:pyridoxamine 5'-phosphate oxidase family protein [Fusobacteriaceae bacterium]
MKKLAENVVNLLTAESIIYVGTCGYDPNVVPVFFKQIAEDGKILIGDVFMKQTTENITKNGKISLSFCDAKTMEGYQIKGSAAHETSGPAFEQMAALVQSAMGGKLKAKGVVVVAPEQVIVTTPGPDNKKEL